MLENNTSSSTSERNIQVAIKVRPVLKREKDAELGSNWKTINNSIQSTDNTSQYCFDYIFDESDSNKIIFDKIAKPIVDASLKGFNGTILAHGQISSGKTFIMLGDETNPGIMCLVAKEIFQKIATASNKDFLLRVGYIEIRNEEMYDLLNKSNQDLKIHETSTGAVVNCTEFIVRSEDEMIKYLHAGSKLRKNCEMNMSQTSNLSHAIFRLIIESRNTNKINGDDAIQISNLNLVILAGTTESRLIKDHSLLSLNCIIKCLSKNTSAQNINYGDSKLTRILRDSLGGNALAGIVCTINPTAIKETNSTLKFAMRAKTIVNHPHVNEARADTARIKCVEKEISRLRFKLEEERSENNQVKVLELENQIKEENLKIISCPSIGKLKKISRSPAWDVETIIEEENIQQESSELKISDVKNEDWKSETQTKSYDLSGVFDLKVDKTFVNLPNISLPSLTRSKSLTPERRSTNSTPSTFEYNDIELEFEELKNFTNLEKVLRIEFDPVKSLSERLDKANDVIYSYKQEKTKLMQENEDLLDDLRTKCKELQENTGKIKILKDANLDLETDLIVLQKKNIELQIEINILIDKEMQHEQSQKNLNLRIKELLDRIAETELENDDLNYYIKNIKSANTSVKCAKCLDHKTKISSLEQNLQIKENELKNSNNVLHDLEQKRMQLQAEYDALSAQLLESSIEKCDKLKNESKNEINQEKQEDVESKKIYYDCNLSEMLKQSLEVFSNIDINNNILKQTVSLFQERSNNYLNQIKDLRHKIFLKDEAFKNLQNQNIENKSTNLKLSNDLQNLRKLVTALQNELNDQTNINESNETLYADHELTKKNDLNVIGKKYSESQLLYTNFGNVNNELRENIENEIILFNRIEKLSTLENDNKELQNKYDDLHAKLNEAQSKLILNQKDFDLIETKFTELQLLCISNENGIKILDENNKEKESTLSQYDRKITELEAVIEELKSSEEARNLNCILSFEKKNLRNNKSESGTQCDFEITEMRNNYLQATRDAFQKDRKCKRQSIHDESRELLTDQFF